MKFFGWFRKKVASEKIEDCWSPKERAIFRFFDGKEVRHEDPMVLFKKFIAVSGDIGVDYKVAFSQSKDSEKAHDALTGRIRDIFGVKPFKEGGLTETECMDLLDHFVGYLDVLKKNTPNTSSSRTAAFGPSQSELDAGRPMPSSSDTNSTEKWTTTIEPESSPTV